jgi:hypothetical protein
MEDTMVEVASIVLFVLNILAATFVAGLIALIITKATETWVPIPTFALSSSPSTTALAHSRFQRFIPLTRVR